jgi:RNA polymerase sigma-70 factor (ECF subfamily)
MSIGGLLKKFFTGNGTGGPDVVGLLYQWYGRKIYLTSYYIMNDQYLAEDVAQETFLTAMTKLDTLRDPAKVEAWLVRTAINKSYEVLKENRRTAALQTAATVLDEYSVLDHLLDDELKSEALDAILLLPVIHQEAVYYKFYRELNCREISDLLGIPERTVRSRLSKSLDLIAKYLGRKESKSDVTGKEAGTTYHRGCPI